ncbi:MAG: glycerol-3-phosphate 1-O-acyltransferase PlsY [Hyphomonas sp.]|uniref:glycerol-3-phosphate 1-O-acyltransferase PlsY n=1 Tax=Hyphomonas sp. TaxID=87 RepID=UPI0034A07F35
MPEWAFYALASMAGYLAGSTPFGLVITKAAGLGDIRAIGSGNIGATNVLRTGRKDLALATLLLDGLKAGLAALAFTLVAGREAGFIAGAAAFVGHCYPVWLNFKGGKGIATYAGLLVFVTPLKGLVIAAPIWLGLFALTRISSLAALAAAAAVPPGTYLMGERNPLILAGLTLLSLFVFWTHRANLGRLLKGTEPRFGTAKSKSDA